MKCRMIDNQTGGLICFVSKEYEEVDTSFGKLKADFLYARLVFIDNRDESILPYIQQFPFSGKLDVCFCSPNNKGLNDAIALYKRGQIRNIIITPNCIFSCSNPKLSLGYEDWENRLEFGALQQYGGSAQ